MALDSRTLLVESSMERILQRLDHLERVAEEHEALRRCVLEKGLLGSCLQELVAAAAGMGRVEVQEGGIGTTMLKILRGF